jgi:hypothetical protein
VPKSRKVPTEMPLLPQPGSRADKAPVLGGSPRAESEQVASAASRSRKMMEEEIDGVVAAVLRRAQEGDMAAAKIVLDRLSPVAGERLIAFQMRPIASSRDALDAMTDTLAAVAESKITIAEAGGLMKLLQDFIRMNAAAEFERRLTALEASAEENDETAKRIG